jgi:hypothetical protein
MSLNKFIDGVMALYQLQKFFSDDTDNKWGLQALLEKLVQFPKEDGTRETL